MTGLPTASVVCWANYEKSRSGTRQNVKKGGNALLTDSVNHRVRHVQVMTHRQGQIWSSSTILKSCFVYTTL